MAELTEVREPVLAKVSEIEQKARENKENRALPTPPGKLVGFRDLQDWLKLVAPSAQDRITIWIYRRNPIINRQVVDPSADNNIDIIFEGFEKLTEEYMRETHGGGNYKFTVKDADKPKTQMGGFFEAVLDIPMIDCPPKLDLREVEWDNPRNKGYKSWCRAKKLINENNMPVIERVESNTPATTGLDAGMMKMMLEFVTKTTEKMTEKEQAAIKRQLGGEEAISKSMNELFLEKMKQEDPNKQMTAITTLITAMKSMTPEPKPDNTMATILPIFMKMIDDSRAAADRQMTLMLELFKSNKPAEKEESTDKISDLKAIIELAREIKGGGSPAEKTTAESLIELGTSVLPGVLNIIGNMTAMRAAANGVAVPGTTVVDANKGPSNFRNLHEQNTMNQPQPVVTQPQLNGAPQVNQNEAATLIQQFGPIIINKLSGEGWEFGAWVSEGFGDAAAAGLAKYGPDALLAAAKTVPQFWQQVESTYGEAHMKKWLASLCNYREIINQMESEDNDEVEEKAK